MPIIFNLFAHKRKPSISADKFIQTLVNETPKFDEMILKDIRPLDSWIGHLPTVPRLSLWNRIRTWIALKFKLLSEWIMPGTTQQMPGEPIEITQDRFKSVWPPTVTTKTNPKKRRKKK